VPVRLFLDATILFSAAWRPAAGLTRLWRLGKAADLLTSPFAIEEARRNLPDPPALSRLSRLLAGVVVVPDATGEVPAAAAALPEKDHPILLAALRAGATHVVTGDHRHFGRWFGRTLAGLRVVTPRQALNEVGGRIRK
jgi:hypothetical protein